MSVLNSSKTFPTWSEYKRDFTVYEDDDILAINKPCGIAVVGDRNEDDLFKLAKSENQILLPVHRIDKATSGLILFAKLGYIHSAITQQFRKQEVNKTYLAVTETINLPDYGIINLPLSIGRKKKERIAARINDIEYNKDNSTWYVEKSKIFEDKKIYPSSTLFVKIAESNSNTLIAIRPVSGRKHQIRVHLAWIGHPIKGDLLFNKEGGKRMFLHSWIIEFNRSWSDNKKIKLEAIPDESFWLDFDKTKSISLAVNAREKLNEI